MWRKVVTIVAVIMLVAGLGFLLFPPISNTVGKQISQNEAKTFDEIADNVVEDSTETYETALAKGEIDEEGYPIDENGNRTSSVQRIYKLDLDRLYKDSVAYNELLKTEQSNLLINDYSYVEPALNLIDYGISYDCYGYVSAPTIDMTLPIFLGASNANMNYGAAHLTYTSLPIGGEKTNTVLAAHTGYVGRIFFDNIRKLDIGDEVTLTNYWESLTYKVVDKQIHKPADSQSIFINDDRDLLTMLTCISGDNGDFDRYYVICQRAE